MVTYAFNPSTREAKISLFYRMSSRTAEATQKKNQTQKRRKECFLSLNYSVFIITAEAKLVCFCLIWFGFYSSLPAIEFGD